MMGLEMKHCIQIVLPLLCNVMCWQHLCRKSFHLNVLKIRKEEKLMHEYKLIILSKRSINAVD